MTVTGLSPNVALGLAMTITLDKLESYHARLAGKQTLIIGASSGRKENKKSIFCAVSGVKDYRLNTISQGI
jgi:hypothetical protein